MGVYSYVVESDVEIRNKEGLKEFLKRLKDGKIYCYDKEAEELAKSVELVKNGEVDYLNFHWDGWKIISYWYDDFCAFLRDLGVFVEGFIRLDCPETGESALVTFQDGMTKVQLYETVEAGTVSLDDCEMDDFVKQQKLLRQL